MNRVLLAAYYFPPLAGVGWMRVTKFAKFLPKAGWKPVVATVDGGYYTNRLEGELPAEVSEFEVLRLRYFPWLPVFLVKLLFPFYVLWMAWRLRHRLDAVVLCGSPFHPFLFAPAIRLVSGLPVVLDMRDGWSTVHEYHRMSKASLVLNPLRRLIERIGFSSACAVVFATRFLEDQYRSRFSGPSRKFVTVTNGFDADDFPPALTETTDGNSVLMAGKFLFYTPAVAGWLIEALAEYPQLRFHYIGEEVAQFRALAERLGAQDRVEASGYQPYLQVLDAVADARLCIVSNSYPEGLGTKIFDYLALHRPVLCFVPAESEVINQFEGVSGITICREPHSAESVAAGLRCALAGDRPDTLSLAGYTRERKAVELAGVLNGCVATTGTAPP